MVINADRGVESIIGSHGKRRIAACGFTLVELLVVIAILAILAALLFPEFARARIAADKATAISNSQQLAIANDLYSNDYDNRFCVYFAGYDAETHSYEDPLRYWPQQVSLYISPVEGRGTYGQALDDDLPKVFFDPVEPFKSQIGTPYQLGFVASWGVSDDLVEWYAPTGINPSKLPCSQSDVANPAQCIHLTDLRLAARPRISGQRHRSQHL